MLDFLAALLDTSGFPPRWRCGDWSPGHGWLHVLSDLGVWSAYMAIPAVLGYFVARKRQVPFRGVFLLFTAFILLCGTTHLMEAAIFWWPAYRLAGGLKLMTAVVSWVTVVALVRVTPTMLAMRTPEELEREVAARRVAEAGLERANAELEQRVRQRTDELERASAALFAERERFRTTLSSIGDAVIATDTAGRVTFLNPAAAELTGWTAGAAAGEDLASVFHIVNESTRETVENPAARALKDGAVVGLANHTVLIARDGAERPIDDCAAPIRDAAGGVAGAVLVFRDVTERHRAEAAVRDSEERYRRLFEANPHPMWVFDRGSLAFLAVNDAAVAKYGYARDEFLALTIKDIRPAEDVPALLADLASSPDGLDDAGVWRHRLKDGRLIRVRIVSHALLFAGRPAEVVLAQDVTDQLRAEEELRLRDRAIRAVAGGILIADADRPDRPIIYVSPGFERLTGYPAAEVLGSNCRFLQGPDTDPAAVARMRDAIRAGQPCAVELLNYRKDGVPFWNDLRISPVRDEAGRLTHFVGVQSDATGRRRLEEQLRRAQKLEAVGRLAGGVAHDFNNLLTVVNGCGELVLADLPADAPARPLVEDIVRAGVRGAALTRQLLAFSRQQLLRVEVFDPAVVLADTARLLARLLGEDVALRTALDPDGGFVRADPGQVEQVVINLAVNGRDAMPRGGTLTVETGPVEVADGDPGLPPDARPGRYVRIAVTDTGTGMPPEVQARLFEPFFTTKEVGRGTGLGLATVYGIVQQSGGFVSVRSAVGAGTTFAVHLPRHEAEAPAPRSALRAAPRPAGGETVLVVEDDDTVRGLAAAVLARHGYRVAAAESGAAALAACDRLPAPPDLVLTDVVMPGMSGRELAAALAARFPRLKVGFLSGYTPDAVLRHGVEEDRVPFLQKPYTPDDLARFVREVLDAPPT